MHYDVKLLRSYQGLAARAVNLCRDRGVFAALSDGRIVRLANNDDTHVLATRVDPPLFSIAPTAVGILAGRSGGCIEVEPRDR